MADSQLTAALALLEQLRPAIDRGERARIVEIGRQLVAMRAALGEQWQALARLMSNNGELGLARAAIDLHAEASGGDAAALYRKAGLLFELGAVREADQVMRTVPEHVPDPLSHAYSRGVAALYLGRFDEGRPLLERVTTARPQSGTAWLSLAMMTDLTGEPELTDRLIAAESVIGSAAPHERAAYYYAVGKALADRGETPSAFAAFARGAEQMKAIARHDRKRDSAHAADAVRGFSARRIAELAQRQREPTDRTIFVTGTPRSGTTLIEHILTGHSAVGDGGELDRLGLLAQEVGGQSHAALVRYVDAQGSQAARALWHHWLDERFEVSGRVVDKSVDASRYLGLVAALLPDAPLIWATRDPLDRAWSCFRTNFLGNAQSWSYDLGDIAAHFHLEERLLGQWMQILGDRLLVVPYESLVAEPSEWIRRILAHCGLDEEPQVFSSHNNDRVVTTASAAQVRRPINRDAVGSAEPYREFLQPFIDAYYR